MKHLIRLSALMAAAVIFALPLGAQSRGGHSSSHGSASHGSATHSYSAPHRSGGGHSTTSVAPRPQDNNRHADRPSGGHKPAVDRKPSHDRPSGSRPGSVSGARKPSGDHANRPSGNRPSGDHADRPSGNRPSGGHADRPSGNRPSAGSPRPQAHRPAPGSRPFADGHRPAPPHMGRARVNPHPGHHYRHPRTEYRGVPVRFGHRGRHGYGHYITVLPPHYVIRRYHGIDYYWCDNIWYRYYAGRYWICRPPFGYVFSPISDLALAACIISYYNDRQPDVVAEVQKKGSALNLSQNFANSDTEYFYNDGVFYVLTEDGQYAVIVPPAGAQVESLPDDYEEITIDGIMYYKVDDTVYRMIINEEGKACFEVLGQLRD